jgi:hypothetical protein
MANPTFTEFFRSQDSKRDNFLARLFALFSEETVHIWFKEPSALRESRQADGKRPVKSLLTWWAA